MKKISIAIDGPAGAGKGTIAKLLAKKLGFIYVDTGAMYRAVGLYYTRLGIDFTDEEKIKELLDNIKINMTYDTGNLRVYLNNEEVTLDIRTEEASRGASKVSVFPCVREKMVKLQQEMALKSHVVMEGRDIGTVVLPDATLKIFLTASTDVRAKRRFKEQKEKGLDVNLEDIKKDIEERDERDSNRETSPLKRASDAILVDSSDMTIDEVVNHILKLLK